MGSYDGAEVCELVSLFLLHNVSDILGVRSNGLCHDDGLAIIQDASGPVMEHKRKAMIKLFARHNLRIIAETNLTQTDILDVNFDLTSGNYWPFRKPNNNSSYINSQSNHPPAIKKHLPSMIHNRLVIL